MEKDIVGRHAADECSFGHVAAGNVINGNRNIIRGGDGYIVHGHDNILYGTGMIVRGNRNIIHTHRFGRLTGKGNVVVGTDGGHYLQDPDVIGPLNHAPPGATPVGQAEPIDLTVDVPMAPPPVVEQELPQPRQASGGPIHRVRTMVAEARDRRNARRRQPTRERYIARAAANEADGHAAAILPDLGTAMVASEALARRLVEAYRTAEIPLDALRSFTAYPVTVPIRDRLRAAANDAVGLDVSVIHSLVYPSDWPDEPAGVAGTAEELCVVCMDRRRATVCLPCGHMCLCVTCSRVQPLRRTCVICRTPLTEIKRLYS